VLRLLCLLCLLCLLRLLRPKVGQGLQRRAARLANVGRAALP
jgi:hypothetical protein